VSREEQTLSFAARPAVVLRHFGQLLAALGALAAAPALAALATGEFALAPAYLGAGAGAALAGSLMMRLPTPRHVQLNEAMVMVALGYLAAPALMIGPFIQAGLDPLDAWFEAVSGVTTTGLTTLGTVEDKPRSFLFARAWMQWYGGLGIVVLSLALVIRAGVITRRLAESQRGDEDRVTSARGLAKGTLVVYLALTGIGVVAMLLARVGLFDSIVLTLASVSTGGFAPYDDSLAGLQSPVGIAVALGLGLLSATSFAVYLGLRRDGWRALLANRQAGVVPLMSVIAAALLAGCFVWLEGFTMTGMLRGAPAMAVSAQTTTGFSTMDPSGLAPGSKFILIVSMLIGGDVGSTAGGFKALRLLIFLKIVRLTLLRASLPSRAVVQPRLAGDRLEDEEIREALLLMLLFGLVDGAVWAVFLMWGYDPMDSLFDVVSATGTVGLSAGVCGPDLPAPLKLLLSVNMLLGRLEILAWLVFLHPRTWFGRRERG